VFFYSYLMFFIELNVINYTVLCNCECNWDFLILCNCNLLNIQPNCILNYSKAYNLFWVQTATKSLQSFLKSFSDWYKKTQVFLLSPVFFFSGLQWVSFVQCLCLHCNAFFWRFYKTNFLVIWQICHVFVI